MSMKDVSIIIPTFHDWHRLSVCLDALTKQSFPTDSFEIIVVNNDPKDSQPQDLVVPINCSIIEENKSGSYAARNAALKIAKGRIIGFTDSDCIPDSDWIVNAFNAFERDHTLDRIGGPLKIFSKEDKPTWVEMYDFAFAFPQEKYVRNGFAVTGNMFAYKKIFDDIGEFDDSLMSGGDNRWGIKANSRGYSIAFAKDVIVRHPARSSLKELIKKEKRVGLGKRNFLEHKKLSPKLKLKIFYFSIKPKMYIWEEIKQKLTDAPFLGRLYVFALRHYLIFVKEKSMLINS
ncbi:glycosyltransferase [Olivibacter sitiensis]|uniref:glycosyltransferase n=1 Tax=Olivibacter sitiensis TaxID=376470 RepID=UPI00040BAB25|nr:glycosyltransferase [Olivibacter sitiensis]